MPDSYGICFTRVIFFGLSVALTMIMLAPTRIATIRKRNNGVYSVPIDQPRMRATQFVNRFTKSDQKKPRLAPGSSLSEIGGRFAAGEGFVQTTRGQAAG